MTNQPNRRIGDYEMLGVLGSGGMGQVFKVRNVISDRIEAMKIILPDLAGRQDLADRFLREIKLLAGLNHPNIAALRTALTVDNQLLMIMEYVEGTTVAAKLEQGPLPLPDAVNYTSQVLEALSYAHKLNIIHRDIKPSNMMVTPEGVVKLMDFGIARSSAASDLTATGVALGSLSYMPPEQVKGQTVDVRSDVYSVGASLYEMVTGECPFKADSSYSLMAAQVQQLPKPPRELRANVPGPLNEIILLAMAKEPAQRFQTADAFRNALSTVPSAAPVAGETASKALAAEPAIPQPAPVPQPVPSVIELAHRPSSNKGKYMALGGLLVAVFLVAAGIYLPRMSKTRAGGNAAPAEHMVSTEQTGGTGGATTALSNAVTPQPAADTVPPAAASANIDASRGKSARTIGEEVKNTGEKTQLPAEGNGHAADTPGAAPDTSSSPPDNSAELAEIEEQIDQLSSRAVAVNDSLDNLRRQQSAQGLGLRGDIAAAQERMKVHVDKAQAAVQNRDLEGAKKYAAQAEVDLDRLEKFLGR